MAVPAAKKVVTQRCHPTMLNNQCRRMPQDHSDRSTWCRWCVEPLEHHAPGVEEIERLGRIRMAAARRASGVPLSDTDRFALDGDRPDMQSS